MCDLGAKHNGAEIDTGFYGGREIAFSNLKNLLRKDHMGTCNQ